MELSNDISDSLGEIRTRLSAPICSTLLEVQQHQSSNGRSIEWIRNLECLSVPRKGGRKRRYGDGGDLVEVGAARETVLRRRRINPLKKKERDYVAVSWVWKLEPGEEDTFERYLIESRVGGQQVSSPVRDIVLDRVMKYVDCFGYKLFWIDRICIDQGNEEEVEVATQAMDLVYRLSQRSLAVINSRIETEKDLNLLAELMAGCFVNRNNNLRMLSQAGRALELVKWLTSASWWLRAWTFQEDYKAGVNMVLLISHSPSLERLKRSLGVFGGVFVPGELCLNSASFRTEVTRFCQAYQQEFSFDQDSMRLCNKILDRAGKYTVRLCEKAEDGSDVIRKPMSPMVLADIGARQITKSWDRLAIVANCCSYDIRLNAYELSHRKFSQSLALLTQHLLNGEIFNNEQQNNCTSSTQNVLGFLQSRSLDSFISPVREQLTFIKGCRLPHVQLVNEGVQTSGHLWRLGTSIDAKCDIKLPGEHSTPDGLDGYQRYRLKQLAHELGSGVHGSRYKTLAADLLHYLDEEKRSRASSTFAGTYKRRMASELLSAMMDPRKVLRLGCLFGGHGTEQQSYRGIFGCDADEDGPEYVFTAYSQPKGAVGGIDKHVSLGVKVLGRSVVGIPELGTKKWVNGLYFASGKERRKVLFPWLDCLKT